MNITLTDRQSEILELISDEYTTAEISQKLGLAVGTIEVHRKALFKKFEVRNVAGLIKKACMMGFFDDDRKTRYI